MEVQEIQSNTRSNTSQRIIALGIVLAFLYWASMIVMTLLLAVLLAYFLDPVVEFFERLRIPRGLGALLVLTAVMAVVGGTGYLIVDRADQFVADWPRYSATLSNATAALNRKLASVEKQVDAIAPADDKSLPPLKIASWGPLRDLFLRGLGSLYDILPVVTFLPFLVFFMLAAKNRIWHATMELFPGEDRARVKAVLDQVSAVLRSYVAGNALVALILVFASYAFFMAISLDYPFLTACASGVLTMVPYLGAVLAWFPPFLIGLTKWGSVSPYLGIAAMLSALHLLGMNVLMPAIVGRRVHLSALAVTIALLFWGWMWGAVGLILAIPITASIKVVCDQVEDWKPLGQWLGA